MAIKLNPLFPLVWRDPETLQVGIDDPLLVLHGVTNAHERVIAALTVGATRPGLSLIARQAGAGEPELQRLLEQLEPALIPPPPPAPARRVAIIGTGTTAIRLRSALIAAGHTVVIPQEEADFGIMVAHYVLAPELFGWWLREDVPHLPVVFSDSVVRVGPVIDPGLGPCLYCLERHRTDGDPAWPAIATQLWGQESPAENAVTTSEVVAMVLRLLSSRMPACCAAEPGGIRPELCPDQRLCAHQSLQVQANTGEINRQSWRAHPECGCAALPGTGSASARPNAPVRLEPRTSPAGGVPA